MTNKENNMRMIPALFRDDMKKDGEVFFWLYQKV